MTDYELLHTVRARIEAVWHDAELRRRWLAGPVLCDDEELEAARHLGGILPLPKSSSARAGGHPVRMPGGDHHGWCIASA